MKNTKSWIKKFSKEQRWWRSDDSREIITAVAGVSFTSMIGGVEERRQKIIADHAKLPPVSVSLGIEVSPGHGGHMNAMAIYLCNKDDTFPVDKLIGFIPKDLAEWLAPRFKSYKIDDFQLLVGGGRCGVQVRLEVLSNVEKEVIEEKQAKKNAELVKLRFNSAAAARAALRAKR